MVVSQNDDMTFGALEAIREAGKTAGVDGDITVISFDAVDAGVELVRNGRSTLMSSVILTRENTWSRSFRIWKLAKK